MCTPTPIQTDTATHNNTAKTITKATYIDDDDDDEGIVNADFDADVDPDSDPDAVGKTLDEFVFSTTPPPPPPRAVATTSSTFTAVT